MLFRSTGNLIKITIFVFHMAETKNLLWESAGKAGLVLGGVSIAYLLCTTLTGKVAESGHAVFCGWPNSQAAST